MSINNIVSSLSLSTQLQVTNGVLDVRLAPNGSLAISSNGLTIYINPNVPGGLISSVDNGLALNPSYLQYLPVDASYTDIQNMHVTPFSLLPPKTGYFYIIDTIVLAMNAQAFNSQFLGGGNVYCQYTDSFADVNAKCSQEILASEIINMQDNTVITIPGGFPPNTNSATSTFWSSNVGNGVSVTNDTASFTGGEQSTFVFHVWYRALNFVA